MTAAVSFRGVSAGGCFEGLSFEVEVASSALILASAEDEVAVLLGLITGMSRPLGGSVHVFGQPLAGLTPNQLYQLRQQIGVVPANGGMISNLKVWENITLPILYTTGRIPAEAEGCALDSLKRLGFAGNIMALPAHLSLHEKRVAAFVRATLCQPRIMVYDNCLEDMPPAARKGFCAATAEFHAASAERTSIYLASSADMVRELSADVVITVHDLLSR